MTVVFTEERSMKATIERLMRALHPGRVEGVDWLVLAFNGKSELEKGFPKQMRSWSYGEPDFLVLRDADGGDCREIKERIAQLAAASGKPATVRIVCQELEAWFLGDLAAVERAYPPSRATREIGKAKFRDPDRLRNAAEVLAALTGDATKVMRANRIAAEISLDEGINRSHSFSLTLQTLRRLRG